MAVITTEGKQWAVDKLQDVAPLSNAKMDKGNWGTGATAENVTNTMASVTEASEARVSGTLSQPAADTDRLVFTQTAASGKTVTEAIRVNTLTKGDANEKLYQRALFTGIPILTSDQVQFTFDNQHT